VLGFAITWALMWLRNRFHGFLLHPIGFAISGS
jgi:hypothetical protein